jgi:retron-type reverse transcriptase
VHWYIEADIKKAFDTINRKVLINLLRKKISDKRFVDNIIKMFNADILMPEGFVTKTTEGIPQGSPLSPILCNIYLHELDWYIMNTLIPKYNKGTAPTLNKVYRNRLTLNAVERTFDIEKQRQVYKSKAKRLANEGIKRIINDDNYIRIKYLRYADDFIIGVRGSKEIALKILKEINTFLKSSLHLSIESEKTKLTYTIGNKANFLGMTIHNTPSNQLPFRNSRSIENEKRTKKRIIALRDAHLYKISKNIRNSILDKFSEDINMSINQGNLKSTKLLYKQFLRYVLDNTNKKQSNRGIFRELADKITISLTDGKFDGIIKKYNDELMEISRKMYVDASENTAKFTDNRTVTSRSTKILPLSETEKMKRVNNLLINAGANSRLTSQGA